MSHQHLCPSGKLEIRRRSLLLGVGAALALGRPARAAAATPTSKRLVVINARGGLDGLSLVAPYGDPNLAPLRAQIMSPAVGKPGGMFDLGGFYGLHPAMPNLYSMYQAGEAAFVHAVGNVALTRSHFDGQDYLQSGYPEVLTNGWLNRVIGLVPGASGMQSGISMSACEPLIVQGPNMTAGWRKTISARPVPTSSARSPTFSPMTPNSAPSTPTATRSGPHSMHCCSHNRCLPD